MFNRRELLQLLGLSGIGVTLRKLKPYSSKAQDVTRQLPDKSPHAEIPGIVPFMGAHSVLSQQETYVYVLNSSNKPIEEGAVVDIISVHEGVPEVALCQSAPTSFVLIAAELIEDYGYARLYGNTS